MRKSKFVKQITSITVAVVITLFCCHDSIADNTDSQAKSQEKGLKGILNLGDIYYSKYNFVMVKPVTGERNEGYDLFSIPLQLRYNFILSDEKRKDKSTYLAPYVNYTIRHDVGCNSWNDVYWNNNEIAVVGVQIGHSMDFWYPNYKAPKKTYMGGLNISLFSEYQRRYQWRKSGIYKSKDIIPSEVTPENQSTGVNLWVKKIIGNNNLRAWGELWGQFAYQSTNFYEKEADNKSKNDYYIGTLAQKAGISYDLIKELAIEPYVTAICTKDFGRNQWNDKAYNNYSQYGGGLRIALNKILPGEPYIYSEYLWVNDRSIKNQDRNNDLKIGFSYWVKLF